MRKTTFLKSLFIATMLMGGGASYSWADDVVVPTPVYFNDFSFAVDGEDRIEIVGNGVFEDDDDARFGRIFHNDPTGTKARRTNYLKLPADILSHSGTTKEMTIGFWVNMKDATDFYFSPMFTAYDRVERASKSVTGETDASWPKFVCLARKLVDINCWGYCDLGNTYNDKGTNAETSAWLDDKAWHYYTITLTSTTVKVYIDGVIENSWTVDGTTAGQVINGIFDAGAAYNTNDYGLKYICLGGNQSDNYDDPDPAFGFDDFAVYDVALSKTQIDQIRANKLNRTVTGTRVGNVDNSTDYLAATSSKITLKPGESYHYSFINYNTGGYYTNYSEKRINTWNNWILPVYDSSDENVIAVRLDNYEDKHHVGETWGSNAGCTSNFNWTNFSGNVNGATVDMTVTFTADKKFTMSSTINTVDGSTWNYSYTNVYTDSPIDLTSNDYIKVALSVSRSWLDITSEGYSTISGTITPAGWSSFASAYPLDLSTISGGTAYYASEVSAGNVTLTSTDATVPAGEGLMIKGTPDATFTINVAASGTHIGDNLLKGQPADGNVAASAGGTYHYVFGFQTADPSIYGFYNLATDTSVPAGKAYLETTTPLSAAKLRIVFDDEATGVNELRGQKEDVRGECYDLQGRRVAQPTRGLYIVNGKKVLIK